MADTEPFRTVAFKLSALGYAVSKGFKEILEPFELHPREFAVLRAVSVEDGQTQQALGDRLQIPRSRMVSIVDELETRGFLERRPNPADRRVREIHVTETGRAVIEQAFAKALAYERQVTDPLTAEERTQLYDLLDRLSSSLGLAGAHPALHDPEHAQD
jgi:DNA-binding MarR family transcriptional regulator